MGWKWALFSTGNDVVLGQFIKQKITYQLQSNTPKYWTECPLYQESTYIIFLGKICLLYCCMYI
jgi:hypothetical protein